MTRRVGLFLAAVLVAVALCATAFVALFTTVWSARTVHVLGVHRLSAQAVLNAARVDPGQPLLRLGKHEIATRVEALDDVSSASVSTSLPGTVTIRVTERVPAGYVQDGVHSWQYVDASGRRFDRLPAPPRSLAELVPAPSAAADPAMLAALATVAQALPASLRSRVELISATAADNVSLILRDKRVIEWGGADRTADKASVIVALLRRPGTHFDVSDPDLVVAR